MTRTLRYLAGVLAMALVSVHYATAMADDAPPRASAEKIENVAKAYIDAYAKSKSHGVEDTWVTLHNNSSHVLHDVWIEYYTCDGEHGVVKYSDFAQVLPNTSTKTVDTTRKIGKCRVL